MAGYQVHFGRWVRKSLPVGIVKLTLVDIRPGIHSDILGLPEVQRIEWPRR
jgi:hypothetical protein